MRWMVVAAAFLAAAAGARAETCDRQVFEHCQACHALTKDAGRAMASELAPLGFNATTIAVWFLAAFAGNFLAGVLGAAWSHLSAAQFFVLTAAVAATSSVLLLLFDRSVRRQSAA